MVCTNDLALICTSPSFVSQTNDVSARSMFRGAISLDLEVDERAGVRDAAADAGVEVGRRAAQSGTGSWHP